MIVLNFSLCVFCIYRYLSKTFGLAYGYVSPDVVIFMGDLLDEGSTAKDIDYETYFQRFQRIFAVDSSTKVYLLKSLYKSIFYWPIMQFHVVIFNVTFSDNIHIRR